MTINKIEACITNAFTIHIPQIDMPHASYVQFLLQNQHTNKMENLNNYVAQNIIKTEITAQANKQEKSTKQFHFKIYEVTKHK